MYALITDLDNTLYDWVSFFGIAFSSMVAVLSRILDAPGEQLLREFRQIHQYYANSEQPFAALELPIVRSRFPGASRAEILQELDEAFHAFNSARRRHLRLYDSVEDTLLWLAVHDVKVIGCTDSTVVNGFYRLSSLLGVSQYFHRVYVRQGSCLGHPDPRREDALRPPRDIVRELARRKPDPEILWSICAAEGLDCRNVWYVGDSLSRDVAMAKAAGVRSVWARYGTQHDSGAWDILRKVTHWTPDEVEEELRAGRVTPDHVIDRFGDVRDLLKPIAG